MTHNVNVDKRQQTSAMRQSDSEYRKKVVVVEEVNIKNYYKYENTYYVIGLSLFNNKSLQPSVHLGENRQILSGSPDIIYYSL